MLLRSLLVACIWTIISLTSVSSFKRCSEIDFCNNLRNRTPEDKYSAKLDSVESEKVNVILETNDDSSDLNLQLFALESSTFRVKISEPDSNRYEIIDVLDGDPKLININTEDVSENDDSITLSSESNKVVVKKSPFSIEFYKNDELEVVLDGSRLSFENSESSQAIAFGVTFPQASRIYGIAERTERLSLQDTTLNDQPYRLRNFDYGGYVEDPTMSMYGAIPVLYGHRSGLTSGIFLHNAAQQWIDIAKNSDSIEAYFMLETGSLDLFIMLGPTPQDVISQYSTLTGTAHLPQLWTLGYHQCRWSYMTQEEVKDVVAEFDNNNFPLDAIWLDIDYTNDKRYFTWDPEAYSDPAEMQRNLSSTNRKLVTIIDPHIKVEEGYFVYDGALEADLFIKNTDGSVFEGVCWPGDSSYMDFLNPDAREYYSGMYSYENFAGSTQTLAGIWNDMNEPSVFNDDNLEGTMPDDVLHYGGVPHRDIHNIYGLLHTKSTHEGLIKRDNGMTRPFILSRSHFAGSQRFASIWTGDSQVNWYFLQMSYPMCINANILGLSFCGSDIGGFDGNPDTELLQRWYQAATWMPFYRAHATKGSDNREPYLYPEDVQEVIRAALQMRYQHLPVWYTIFYEHTKYKSPVIRPLFYHYPDDEAVFDIDDEILVGQNILVKPVLEAGVESIQVYFPGGEDEYWVSENSLDVYQGIGFVDVSVNISTIPVYYRAGSVIPRKNQIRSSSVEMEDDDHTLYVILDKDNKAHGTVYLDDYTSFKYRDNAEYNYINIDIDGTSVILSPVDESANSENFPFKISEIVYLNIDQSSSEDIPRKCEKIVYEKNESNGSLLKDMKFALSEKVTLKLK